MVRKMKAVLVAGVLTLGGVLGTAVPAHAVTQYFSPGYSTKSACLSAQYKHPNIAASCFYYSDGRWHFTYVLRGYM